jgi:starch synthase
MMGPKEGLMSLRVLFVASEVAGLAKTGGLADVTAALPVELDRSGLEVRVVMPDYVRLIADRDELSVVGEALPVPFLGTRVKARVTRTDRLGVPVFLIGYDPFFDRDYLYGPPEGGYWDNAERFGFFCQAVLALVRSWDWRPDVIHAHDWQTALVGPLAAAAEDEGRVAGATLLTIHNLEFQGRFGRDKFRATGLPPRFNESGGLEFWGDVSFLKGGIIHADGVGTVSPNHAAEIQTPDFGFGLDGVLRERGGDVFGILNGIDTEAWDPATDSELPATFSPENLTGKAACKAALLQELGLAPRLERPLIGVVTRLTWQKGFQLLRDAWPDFLDLDCSLVMLGSSPVPELADFFTEAAADNPDRIAVVLDQDAALARRILGGADLFLMPSLNEPCGLTQMYALRYGTVPVVRAVGGLKDTVTEIDPGHDEGVGYCFQNFQAEALIRALTRAGEGYLDAPAWHQARQRGMSLDHSWAVSARGYLDVYQRLVNGKRPEPGPEPAQVTSSVPDSRSG